MIWQIPFCLHQSANTVPVNYDPLFVTVVIFIPKQFHSTVRFRTAASAIGCLIAIFIGCAMYAVLFQVMTNSHIELLEDMVLET